jgi:PrcB C-terminal
LKLTAACFALVALALVSCSSTGEAPQTSGPVEFESLVRQEQTGLVEPEQRVIRTEQAWSEAWKQIMTYRIPAPELPAVDFERDMVVLVALGERPTAGYAVEVVSIQRDGAFLRVVARETKPSADMAQATVLTHPVHAVRVPRSDGPVEVAFE